MGELKRYDHEPCQGYEPRCDSEMEEDLHGEWVLYDDHKSVADALRAERDEARSPSPHRAGIHLAR